LVGPLPQRGRCLSVFTRVAPGLAFSL
jgi:hypothetical protein